ncbi:GntR family transcriptional regulator [Mesorhizobium sp. CAU 1732]|uniref:GntR family transcriptional regulator n=1 Tax=Mesorhizobium sp. CAU 1732 TaxID=3140358 RepID=UPI0032610DCA
MARRRTLTDEIYDELRRQIVDVELLPGTVLPEKSICEQFGVSRTPLREAILLLVQSGLVVVAPQFATFVAPLDPAAVREAHFLRNNLEPAALRLLCSGPFIDLSSLRAVVLEQRLLLAREEFSAFLPLDDQFHRLIFELAGLSGVWSIIHTKKAHLDRVRHLQAPQKGKIPLLIEQHEAILDALERRDAEAAEAMLRTHISGAIAYMSQLEELRPELFRIPDGRGRVSIRNSPK